MMAREGIYCGGFLGLMHAARQEWHAMAAAASSLEP